MLNLTLPQLNQPNESPADMEKLNNLQWKAEISFISFGIRIGIRVNETTVLERLLDYLPPEWKPSSSLIIDKLYSLIVDESYPYYQLYRQHEELIQSTELEDILETFDSDLRLQIGIAVRDKLFVHAGVVGWCGKAIVIPGRSFSGKTTLVKALVQAGAIYYSDEYAVFDTDGRVHPYSRPLSVRQETGERVKRCPVEELGGKSGTESLSVGLIAHIQYQPDAQWNPKQMSPGEAVLALLDNTIVARLRPEFALPILAKAVSSALTLEGERAEADSVALSLLQQLS